MLRAAGRGGAIMTTSSKPSASLRDRAEAQLRKQRGCCREDFSNITAEEYQFTLHELRVHQIELEIQNEGLRRTQLELEASRANCFDLYDLAPVGYCSIAESGLILQANLKAAELLGLSRSELVGQRFSLFIATEDQDAFYLLRKKLLASTESHSLEIRLVKHDGTTFWAELDAASARDPDGTTSLRAILSDITEKKTAGEHLQKLRMAVEQSANAIIITDAQGTIEYVNPAFEKCTGYARSEVIGKNPRILKSGEHDASFYRELWTTLTSGKIWHGEMRNRHRNGSIFWESATISPVLNTQGTIVAFIAVKEDITERKSLEISRLDAIRRAETANRAKSDFLAVMSHELRTPLNGVLGFAELLADTPLNQEQKEFTQTIRESGTHLLQVVNDILDFSSIEKDRLFLETAPFAVGELVETALSPTWKSARDKGLALRYLTDPETPRQMTGDVRRIRQILLNLVGNAVKFTQEGSVLLRVSPAKIGNAPALDFSIEDTGVGIQPAAIDKLFTPFMQEDTTLHRAFEGTGLGLAISQRLAIAMGGLITVESTPGKGSIFTLRIPVTPPPAACIRGAGPVAVDKNQPPGAAQAKDPSPPAKNGCVLVVEDDPYNSSLAGKMLSALHYRAEFAFHGEQALQAYASGKFSAILMDMQMPVMDGLEATRKIRETERISGAHIPIIALTANVMPGDHDRCLAAGMDDFLSKPFNKQTLAEKLVACGA